MNSVSTPFKCFWDYDGELLMELRTRRLSLALAEVGKGFTQCGIMKA